MKIKAALVVVALLLSMTAPFSVHISGSDGVPVLVSLNVCSAAGAALTANTDVTVIQECSFELFLPTVSGHINLCDSNYFSLVLISNQERPPEA
jgi:hypothetical protein